MSVGKLSKKESVLMDRKKKRKSLLKKATITGFKRPEGWGPEAKGNDTVEVIEEVVEKQIVEEVESDIPEDIIEDSTEESKEN